MGMQIPSSLLIFTDGASRGNPGPGGWGAVLVNTELSEIVELGGNKSQTTNNEMELTAVIAALAHSIGSTAPVHIYTDSKYVMQGATQWLPNWKERGWKTKQNTEVMHQALWQQLDDVMGQHESMARVMWHHVPGHAGIPGNERADTIATRLADGMGEPLYRGNQAGYAIADIADVSSLVEARKEKKEKKQKTGKAYEYLSAVDGKLERHQDWASCQKRVSGKKASYRKSYSAEESAEIIESWKHSGALDSSK